jgi:putative Mn2+ efflux pump MntP
MEIFNTKRSFKAEFKRQLRLAIAAAVGFTVAYAWRTAIFDGFQSFTTRLLDIPTGHYLSETYTSIAITLAGVLFIMITSKLLKDKK